MAKTYPLPSKVLVGGKLIKWEVLDWLSRNIGAINLQSNPEEPIFEGRGWKFTYTERFRGFKIHYIPKIEFSDDVPNDIILYFLLRFGDSSE